MLRHRLSRLLPATTTLAALASPAFAQDLSPIQTMLETVEAALTASQLYISGTTAGTGGDLGHHFLTASSWTAGQHSSVPWHKGVEPKCEADALCRWERSPQPRGRGRCVATGVPAQDA